MRPVVDRGRVRLAVAREIERREWRRKRQHHQDHEEHGERPAQHRGSAHYPSKGTASDVFLRIAPSVAGARTTVCDSPSHATFLEKRHRNITSAWRGPAEGRAWRGRIRGRKPTVMYRLTTEIHICVA